MATTNTKSFLLFQPQLFFSNKPVISIRQLIKTPDGFSSGEQSLTRSHLKSLIKNLDDNGIITLLAFSPDELKNVHAQISLKSEYINDNEERDSFIKKTYRQHLYQLVARLRHLSIGELYHPVWTNSKHYQHKKCTLYPFPVDLIFRVAMCKNEYTIEVSVQIKKEEFLLSDFKRYFFLIEKEDNYYQLSPQSFYALQYTTEAFESLDGIGFSKKRIKQCIEALNQWDVQTDNSILADTENSSAILPECQVFLSELNNAFLKLEPQFIYDGVTTNGNYEPVTLVEMNQKTIAVKRNEEVETRFIHFLRSLHEKFDNQRNGFFYLTFADAQKKNWFIKTYHLFLDKKINLTGVDLLKHFRYAPHKAKTIISHQETVDDTILLSIQVEFGKESVPLSTLQKALLNHQKAVLLKDGSLGILDDDWMRQYALIFRHGSIKKNQLLIAKWLLLGDQISDQAENNTPNTKATFNSKWFLKWQRWEKKESPIYPLPSGLRAGELRPYQQTGYEWLRLLAEIGTGGCLADDMGLGKTLQTICFLLWRIEERTAAKCLIVAPASLLYNWQKEFEKFAPSLQSAVFHGSARAELILNADKQHVFITSYGTLRQDIDLLKTIDWDTIILDESHHIKNPAARTTRAVWQLTARTKVALSGTPVMNSTSDLYSQMHFIVPGLLGTQEFFKKEYTIPIEQQGNNEKAAALQKLIRPFILRRTKEQVARDLPERTESILWCEMEPNQRAAYEAIKESIRDNIFTEINAKGLQKGKMSVLAGLTKLRLLCNSTELVKHAEVFTSNSVKTKVLINELKLIIPRHRVLVFSQFASMLDLLSRDLTNAGIATLRLDGQTPVQKRQELVNTFQSDDGNVNVFLISLKAGNTGLTLTRADYVFLFDPWWNAAVESQAIDRTHRIGQNRNVFAYRMVCRDSIEEKIIRLSSNKKKLAEDLITADENFMRGITLEDIQFLFE